MVLYDDGIIRVRESQLSDVEYLENRLRRSDVAELWAADHVTPKYALMESFDKSSHCFTIENGKPIAMFGVVPDERSQDVATAWLLASDVFKELNGRVARESKRIIDFLLTKYSLIENFVDERNKDSIKWLRFCGADMSEPMEYGPDKMLFRYFCIRKNGPLTVREKTNTLATAMMQTGEADMNGKNSCPVKHSFADGMYIREIFMPKGTLLISKIHKKKHPYFVLKGKVQVSTEEGVVVIEAPYHGMTEPGTRRTLLVEKDTVWITVHKTEHKDLVEIEKEIIGKNFDSVLESEGSNKCLGLM